MKLVSYNKDEQDQLAVLVDGLLHDTDLMHPDLPVSMAMFLNYWDDVFATTASINKKLEEGVISRKQGIDYDAVEILTPVPHATSFRNAYAFGTIGGPAHESPGHDGKYPAFYFMNHNCFRGGGEVVCMPEQLKALDFELSVAVVICKAGKNIKAADAGEYIGGFMIMNNLASRHFGLVNAANDISALANGKGFAVPIGPALVTMDELEAYRIDNKPGHTGSTFNLALRCLVNDNQVCAGNLSDMEWTFEEIIEHVSYGVQLFPGDIIGSGPVNPGSFLQLNTLAKQADPGYAEQWLKAGDVVELQVEALGTLSITIAEEKTGLAADDAEVTDDE